MSRSPVRSMFVLAVVLLVVASAAPAAVLVPRDGSPPIRVRSHRVEARLVDGLARTTLRQTFVNPHGRALEAVYEFPLPPGAALAHVAMEAGGKRHEGLLVERQKARRTYDAIVRRKKDPALVEQVGDGRFRLSVFPVLPGQPTVVEITYTQLVPLAHGVYRYVYPLALDGPAAKTEQDLTVTVRISSSAPIREVTSPTVGMDVRRRGENEAVASMEKTGARLDRDVVVQTRVATPEPTIAVRSFRAQAGPGTFLAVITPPEVTEDRILPRDVVLVLDTSGSMEGVKIEQARSSAEFLVKRLRPKDRANVLLFSSAVVPFAAGPVDVTPENRAKLLRFVANATAGGGTALGDALGQAIAVPEAAGRARSVVLLTDGLPTIGETSQPKIVDAAAAGVGKGLRIFTFGVGEDVDAGLLRGIARAGHGAAEIFRPGGEIRGRVERFLRRTESPVLTGLEVRVEGVTAYDLQPRPLPDVYLGEQVVVAGRYREGGPATVVASAVFDGKRVALRARANLRGEPGGSVLVRDAWGRRKLSFLEETLRLRTGLSDDAYFTMLDRGRYDTSGEIVRAIVDLSLECGIQSAYTSWLVLLPEDRARLDPRDPVTVRAARRRRPVAYRYPSVERDVVREPPVHDIPPIVEEEEPIEDPSYKDSPLEVEDAVEEFEEAPVDGEGVNDRIGIGGAAGGRRGLRAEGGGGTDSALGYAFRWLRWHQDPEGYWDADGFEAQCKLNRCGGTGGAFRDRGATGLALLAFLGAGHTHKTGTHKQTVRRALKYLKQIQDPEGCFGPRKGPDWMLDNAIASLAMAEAYALTGSPLFKLSTQNAVTFLLAAQNPDGGWGREIRDGTSRTSITIWAVMALQSARMAGGIRVDPAALAAAGRFVESVTDGEGRARETLTGDPADRPTPAAAIARVFLGASPREDALLALSAERCLEHLPSGDGSGPGADPLYRYFGSLFLFQVTGEPWKRWNAAMRTALIAAQRKEGDERGSWESRAAGGLGRVGATALHVLCLETLYRHFRIIDYGPRRRR